MQNLPDWVRDKGSKLACAPRCKVSTLHKKVKDILKFSTYFVQFHELALILVFKSRYRQTSLTFLCSVDIDIRENIKYIMHLTHYVSKKKD